MPFSNSEIIGIIGIFASIGFFYLGYRLGRKNSKDLLELFVKALNVDRALDDRDKNEEKLFVEDDTVKGVKTIKESITITADLINLHDKMLYSENGNRRLTDQEIRDMGKDPKYWKSPCP